MFDTLPCFLFLIALLLPFLSFFLHWLSLSVSCREAVFRFMTSTVGIMRRPRGCCWSSIRSGVSEHAYWWEKDSGNDIKTWLCLIQTGTCGGTEWKACSLSSSVFDMSGLMCGCTPLFLSRHFCRHSLPQGSVVLLEQRMNISSLLAPSHLIYSLYPQTIWEQTVYYLFPLIHASNLFLVCPHRCAYVWRRHWDLQQSRKPSSRLAVLVWTNKMRFYPKSKKIAAFN